MSAFFFLNSVRGRVVLWSAQCICAPKMWNQLSFVPQSSSWNCVQNAACVLCILDFCSCHNYFYLILSWVGNSDFEFFRAGLCFSEVVIFCLGQGDLHIHTDLYDFNDEWLPNKNNLRKCTFSNSSGLFSNTDKDLFLSNVSMNETEQSKKKALH